MQVKQKALSAPTATGHLSPMHPKTHGITHMVSDFAGIGEGFRDSNIWLATLTHHAYPATFYAGDALGSFNSWMRWFSGILFGAGIVWFGFLI
jgi:hypothetical protein